MPQGKSAGQMRTLEVQMSKNKHSIPVAENVPKEDYNRTVQNCPVRDVNGASTLIAVQKSGVSAREKPRKHRMHPRLALISASTTRGATQCQRSIMTGGSQPVCSVTNTNNRFQVTFYYPN